MLLVSGSIWENNVDVQALCSYLSSGCFKVRVSYSDRIRIRVSNLRVSEIVCQVPDIHGLVV